MPATTLLTALGLPGELAEESAADARILDAALTLVGEIGERRLTIDDVAATAKVGRRTVFRRFGSKDALLQRLYHREVLRAVEHIAPADAAADDVADVLVGSFCRLVSYSTGHPVIRRLSRAEPETLVELWRSGGPSGHDMAVLLLRAAVDPIAHDVKPRDLTRGCEVLAELLFAAQLLPGTASAFSAGDADTVRALLVPVLFPFPTTRGS